MLDSGADHVWSMPIFLGEHMNRTRWRALLATPALLALIVGGSVLTAPAANAASLLSVTAPSEGSTVSSRTVEVTGLAPADSTVVILDASQTTELGRGPVTADLEASQGTFDISLTTYADSAPTAQSIVVTVEDASEASVPVTFNLPAAPAAPVDAFAVITPTEGQVFTDSYITFTGTGTDQAVITIRDASGERVPGNSDVSVVDGTWTTDLSFAAYGGTQALTIEESVNNAPAKIVQLTITVPAPTFTITSPNDGEVFTTADITFTGTGTDGAIVTVNDSLGRPVTGENSVTVVNGVWSAELSFANYSGERSFAAYETLDDTYLGAITRVITLPTSEPVFYDAPIFTSPTQGQTIAPGFVTFTGTATRGTDVYMVAVPRELIENPTARSAESDLMSQDAAAEARVADVSAAAAAAEPVYPLAPVRVDNAGNWSIMLSLGVGDYVALAVLIDPTAEGTVLVSPISDPVEFTVAAAPVVIDNGNVTGPTNSPATLAKTGVETPSLLGIAGLLAAAGILLMLARSRSLRSVRVSAGGTAPRD